METPKVLWQNDISNTRVRFICVEKGRPIITLCNPEGQALVDYEFTSLANMEEWIAANDSTIKVIR